MNPPEDDHAETTTTEKDAQRRQPTETELIARVQRVLDHELTNDLTAAYRTAVQHVPDLVRRECRPLDFLRTPDMDPHAAATRLARYWTLRREL